MFEDFDELLDKKNLTRRALTYTSEIDSFLKSIDKDEREPIYRENYYTAALRQIEIWKKECIDILLTELDNAITQNKEYEKNEFKWALHRSFNNEGIIRFIILENTDYTEVIIDAEKYAGTGEEYMEAVQVARLFATIKGKDMLSRSSTWAFIYRSAREGMRFRSRPGYRNKTRDRTAEMRTKYNTIIADRLSSIAHNKAPFWYLLNYGSASVSGEGGIAYPYTEPTNFLEKARIAIERFINNKIRAAYEAPIEDENIDRTSARLNDVLQKLNDAMGSIENLEVGQSVATVQLADRELQYVVKESKGRKKLGVKTKKYRSYLE